MTVKAVGVASVKGGVGKSVTAINLAKHLIDKGVKVAFIDADLDNSNFSQFTNLNEEYRLEIVDTKKFIPYDWNGLQVFSMSLLIGRQRSVSMKDAQYVQILRDVVRHTEWDAEYFIVDLPGGSSTIFRSVTEIFAESYVGNVIITQPSMIDALNRTIRVHKYFNIPILGIIENMAYWHCAGCGKDYYPFGNGKTEKVLQQHELGLTGKIPFDTSFASKIDEGKPFLPKEYDDVFDVIIDRILSAEVKKLSLAQRIKSKITDKLKGEVEKLIASMFIVAGTTVDIPRIREETGFKDEKVVRLIISSEDFKKEITRVVFRTTSEGLKVIKNPKNVDFTIILSFRTLARVLVGKQRNGNELVDYDAMDAWLNGDIISTGDYSTPKTAEFFARILTNEDLKGPIVKRFSPVLEKWI